MNSNIDWAQRRAVCTTDELFEEVKRNAAGFVEALKMGDDLQDRDDFRGLEVDDLEEQVQRMGVLRFKNRLPDELRRRDNHYAWLTYHMENSEIVAELKVGLRHEYLYATAYWNASEDVCELRVNRGHKDTDGKSVRSVDREYLDVETFVRWSLEPFLFLESDDDS